MAPKAISPECEPIEGVVVVRDRFSYPQLQPRQEAQR
jgi:hypothetical protein